MLNSFLIGIISGVISGIIASFVVQLIIYLSKPNIIISDNIAKQNGPNGPEYRIKIVNKSKAYAKDLSVQVNIMSRENAINGNLLSAKPLPLVRKDISYIEPFDKKDEDTKYAIRVRINSDLENVWKDDKTNYVEIKVFCTNELTSAGKVFSKEYKKKVLIKEGEFEAGQSMDITKTTVEGE